MATLSIILDTRSSDKQGLNSLKLAISHSGARAYITLNYRIKPSQWDKAAQRVTNHPQRQQLNSILTQTLLNAQTAMLQIQSSGGLRRLSAFELKNKIQQILNPTQNSESNKTTLHKMFDLILNDKTKSSSTRRIYCQVKQHLAKCDNGQFLEMKMGDIKREHILSIYGYMLNHLSKNSAHLYMSKISALFNRAIDDELINNYPFRRVSFKKTETAKRALTLQQLRAIYNYKSYNEKRTRARDFFMLIFYMIGINISDLYELGKMNSRGYVEYHRNKTSKLYKIKLTDEARHIVNKYNGGANNDVLIDFKQFYKSFVSFRNGFHYNLRELCSEIEDIEMPDDITSYWARHTWATIASQLDIPKDVISRALGHSFGVKTTDIYIKFDDTKIDEANRRVIDYVLYDKK